MSYCTAQLSSNLQ
uniref:Uncharacterized protein n=1 Tax=Arundo donax TaxID=35708 RepID=A0A0A9BQY5_ARUDO